VLKWFLKLFFIQDETPIEVKIKRANEHRYILFHLTSLPLVLSAFKQQSIISSRRKKSTSHSFRVLALTVLQLTGTAVVTQSGDIPTMHLKAIWETRCGGTCL
jgi:hypothetical protein